MKIIEQTITVKVSKTVQEKPFESLQVQLEESRTYDKIDDVEESRQELYEELKEQLDTILEDN